MKRTSAAGRPRPSRSVWAAATLALFAFTPGGCGAGSTLPKSRDERPNIILIMADDMGFSDIGCYGSEISTPHLDRLASQGLRFSQFYNMARCCPTRASLLTGLHPHQTGIGHMTEDLGHPSYQGDLNRQCVTIAEALRPAGYRTAAAGKWHVTPGYKTGSRHNWPLQRGFERYYGEIIGAGSYYDPPILVRDNQIVETREEDYFYTDAITTASVEYIEEFGGKPEPFFLYTAYTAPHWPLHALPEDIERVRPLYEDGWDAIRRQRLKRLIEMGLVEARWALSPRDGRIPAWQDALNKPWQIERMAVYAAMIEHMDRGIGRILGKLKELGLKEKTLVLFLADNGGCAEVLRLNMRDFLPEHARILIPERTRDGRPVREGNDPSILPGAADTYASYGVGWANVSNTPFRLYKHWVHEGGIATPLVARWPGVIPAGGLTHQPGQIIDIMATCLDVARTQYPTEFRASAITPLQGKSLLPIFQGKTRGGHEALYWEHEGNRAVRQGKWKLVSRFPGDWELYDLQADRTELHDLAGEHPERVAEMSRLYDAWAARTGVEPWQKVRPGG